MDNRYHDSLISKVKGNYAELKEECQDMGLEDVYQNYVSKIYRNYLCTLIIIHIIITIVHSIVTYHFQKDGEHVVYDFYIYLGGAGLTCLILQIYLSKKYGDRVMVPFIVSWAGAFTMAATDVLVNLSHYITYQQTLRPCYAGYVISTVYLFMPLQGFLQPLLLGCSISVFYAADFLIVTKSAEESRDIDLALFVPDLFFLVGLNMLGIFNRWRRETVTRIVFLTRRQTLEQSLIWKYAKHQEKSLLVSIIPEPIAKKIGQEIQYRIQRAKVGALTDENGRKLFIESHEDVSILFADLVNFTFLTTQLDVKSLVEILHDLFQRFDKACKQFNVMRIKFLGDCYYGVSGVPVSHPLHSVCCIELGRSIIKNVREVRAIKNVDIDMRVGIHSGSLLAGIIGSSKWQYDIWSKDVNIANCLESTGLPGRVHISKATLTLADGYYICEEGTERAKSHPTLLKYNIKTFLIIEPSAKMKLSDEWQNYVRSKEEADYRFYNLESVDASFDDAYQLEYQEIVNRARELMELEIENLPICKLQFYGRWFTRQRRLLPDEIEEYRAKSSISSVCLIFGDWNWEIKYLAYRADEFYKFPVIISFLILLCVIAMQAANKYIQNMFEFWIISGFMVLLLIIPIAFIWHKNIEHSLYRLLPLKRYVRRSMTAFRASRLTVGRRIAIRSLLYLMGMTAILIASYVHLILCDNTVLENDDEIIYLLLEEGVRTLCFNSWAVTESLCLYVALALSWPRISFLLSLMLTIPLLIVYIIMVLNEFSLVFEASISTNEGASAEFAHIWGLLIIFYTHILIARHIIFISKCNYFNRWQLQEKTENSNITNESIRVLLHNILPAHVVQIYLTKRLQTEPFYEQHDYAAVMFATIIHRRTDSMDLRLMNEIICDFDEILSFYKYPVKVEKIKVINWTYMAACGLSAKRDYWHDSLQSVKSVFVPNRYTRKQTIQRLTTLSVASVESENPSLENLKPRKSILPDSVASNDYDRDDDDSDNDDSDDDDSDENDNDFPISKSRTARKGRVVQVLANFAVDFLKVVKSFNESMQKARNFDNPPIQLRIGISSGEVMAGVVGSFQAHYDVWGNAVNMASRMDTTGEPGRIQVTEETAEVLRSFDIGCTYRGLTEVKGRGNIPTYFINVDEEFKFQEQ
ncbi:adenylyl cyclase X E-like [Glossina fuscipes fuscipes]